MSEPIPKRITREQIVVNGFDMLAIWSVSDHWADVKIYEIIARQNLRPLFQLTESTFSPNPTDDIEKAEVYLEGYIKWDGCCELDQGCPHWCGRDWINRQCELLQYLYRRAFELMGRPPED